MFGKNQLASQHVTDGLHLRVQSVFSTIQGEGPYAGYPALFIRLNGCNLRCTFCDTDFESVSDLISIDKLLTDAKMGGRDRHKRPLVVLTGGEPLLQNVVPLITLLEQNGIHTQIETAGTVWIEGLETTSASIIVSPKTPKVHPMIERVASAWKYLIRDGHVDPEDGLPVTNTQDPAVVPARMTKLARPPSTNVLVFLQPCEEYMLAGTAIGSVLGGHPLELVNVPDTKATQRNVALAVQLCMMHGYRLSMQLHKILGLP